MAGKGVAGWGANAAMRDPAVRRVVELICGEFDVSLDDLFQPSRGVAEIAHARQLAMYLCYVCLGRTLVTVGRLFGRDRSTASYACVRMEDLRDDPAFEAQVSRLEEAIGSGEPPAERSLEIHRAAS